MDNETKLCKFCKRENYVDNSKCLHCGRFFPSEGTREPESAPTVKRPEAAIQVEHLKLIPVIILLISLFLPWLSWFVVRLTAFDIADFFNMAARMSGRSTLSMVLIQILIYMIPVGCGIFIFRSLTNRSIKTTGIVTGILPILVFLLVISQPTAILRMVSIGFLLALLSGIALISISVKE
ncbi:MAG: hypothetical protein KAS21_04160 [Candidatus Aminicenantes bacterium]|nr:hypothetical protein [Candidatus Aminicenantes bacterium]